MDSGTGENAKSKFTCRTQLYPLKPYAKLSFICKILLYLSHGFNNNLIIII